MPVESTGPCCLSEGRLFARTGARGILRITAGAFSTPLIKSWQDWQNQSRGKASMYKEVIEMSQDFDDLISDFADYMP